MSGQVLRIFFLSSLAQIMKAFIGLLMWGLPSLSLFGWRITLFPYPLPSSSFLDSELDPVAAWENFDIEEDPGRLWWRLGNTDCWWWWVTGPGKRPDLRKSRSGSWGKGVLGKFWKKMIKYVEQIILTISHLEESMMTKTRIEAKWRMKQWSGRSLWWYWSGGYQIRKLGLVEHVDRMVWSCGGVLGEVVVGLWCGGAGAEEDGVKILFRFGEVERTVIMESLGWRWSRGRSSWSWSLEEIDI